MEDNKDEKKLPNLPTDLGGISHILEYQSHHELCDMGNINHVLSEQAKKIINKQFFKELTYSSTTNYQNYWINVTSLRLINRLQTLTSNRIPTILGIIGDAKIKKAIMFSGEQDTVPFISDGKEMEVKWTTQKIGKTGAASILASFNPTEIKNILTETVQTYNSFESDEKKHLNPFQTGEISVNKMRTYMLYYMRDESWRDLFIDTLIEKSDMKVLRKFFDPKDQIKALHVTFESWIDGYEALLSIDTLQKIFKNLKRATLCAIISKIISHHSWATFTINQELV
jgi:hypothetical protein